MNRRDDTRWRDLQIDRALGLTTREREQDLGALGRERREEADSYDLAAAALHLALGTVQGDVPERIRERIVQDGIYRLGSTGE
jgi:hypothetical protein